MYFFYNVKEEWTRCMLYTNTQFSSSYKTIACTNMHQKNVQLDYDLRYIRTRVPNICKSDFHGSGFCEVEKDREREREKKSLGLTFSSVCLLSSFYSPHRLIRTLAPKKGKQSIYIYLYTRGKKL